MPPNEEENESTDKVRVCMCVFDRLGQSERWLKIEVGPKMEDKTGRKVSVKQQRERHNTCLNVLVDETSNSLLVEPLISTLATLTR